MEINNVCLTDLVWVGVATADKRCCLPLPSKRYGFEVSRELSGKWIHEGREDGGRRLCRDYAGNREILCGMVILC